MANKLGATMKRDFGAIFNSNSRNNIANDSRRGTPLHNSIVGRLPHQTALNDLLNNLPQKEEEVQVEEPEKDPYMEAYDKVASRIEGMSASQKAALEAKYKEAYGLLNKNYDRNANYAYINYKQGQKQLPEELSNLGITGGASESAVAKLQNAYGQNLSQNEYERNNQLASARSNYNEALSGVDTNLNAQLADVYANFAQQSLVYNQEKKAKAEAEAKSKALAEKNNDTYSRMAARIKQGYDVTTWTDEEGYFKYRLVGNAKKDAKKSAKALADAWAAAQRQAMSLANQGFTSTIKTDSNGVPYAIPTGKKKLGSSGSGSGGSKNYSGGGGSNSPSAVPNNGGGGSNKPKPKINYSQATSYFNQNIAKILGDPNSVVKDLNKKMKSGEMNEITADYIMTKFPRKKKG